MDTGFLLLLEAAKILESPPYSDKSVSPTKTAQVKAIQKDLKTLTNQIKQTKAHLNHIMKSTLMNRRKMVPIGSGKTIIPRNVHRLINWSSYTAATRKLLSVLFCRSVLATHSLTGKQSNAFRGTKPSKKRLNPTKVNDVIKEVTYQCKVDKSLVRNVITTKCAEESRRGRLNKSNKIQKAKWFI